jgi:S-formylglutathione hydrolase FrmB
MIILMPSDTGAGHGSGYTDWNDGFTRAETYLVEELLPWATNNLPVSGVTALAGLSMGGYAALMLALRHPNTFSSASSMSGFFRPRRLFQFILAEPERIWANKAEESQHNVEELIIRADGAEPLEIFFDCGHDDPMIEDNRRLHQLLVETGIPHQYAEHRGGHDWDYWRQHLDDHLRFHARAAARYERQSRC